jgi:hypothetical protein
VKINKQTVVKQKSKVVILSDSHLKGCVKKINNLLGDSFLISGWTKPGALAEEILDGPNMDLMGLDKQDVIVISAGANDIYRNNSGVALRKTIQFIQNNYNTNIIVYGVPQRYDLLSSSCVNVAIQTFNSKLKNLASSFSHVSILESNSGRNSFTSVGMHLNERGKRIISKQLATVITKLTVSEITIPKSLEWFFAHESGMSNDVMLKGSVQIDITSSINDVNDVCVEQNTGDLQASENDDVLSGSIPNIPATYDSMSISQTKSKRPRRVPTNRSSDFLW